MLSVASCCCPCWFNPKTPTQTTAINETLDDAGNDVSNSNVDKYADVQGENLADLTEQLLTHKFDSDDENNITNEERVNRITHIPRAPYYYDPTL